MIEKNYERVEIPSSLSRAPSITSIGDFSAPFGNFYPISEKVDDSTQNLHEKNPPQAQTLPTLLPPIVNLYPISYYVNPQTDNNLTAPNLPEHNNPPVVMAAPHPCTLIGKKFPEVIIPDHNSQPKLKSETGFLRKSVVFFPILYLYRDKVSRDDLMEEFTETFGPYTYGRIVQVPNI